jgi:transcriptional regulator with XRE-family HTH domain
MNISEIIVNKRKTMGLSIERLARGAGISSRSIINLEKGRYSPTLSILERVCDVLNIEIALIDKEG